MFFTTPFFRRIVITQKEKNGHTYQYKSIQNGGKPVSQLIKNRIEDKIGDDNLCNNGIPFMNKGIFDRIYPE